MQQFLWEIVVLLIVTGGATLLFCYKRSKSFGVTDEAMMHVIANHIPLQSYFNHEDEIRDVQILSFVYSPDNKGALIQVLCKRTADGNSTLRIYFVIINDDRYSPRLVAESTRSLDWGNNLAFYDELKPVEVMIYSGYWVEVKYQQLALGNFDGITLNWKTTQEYVKFAIAPRQQADVLIIPVSLNKV